MELKKDLSNVSNEPSVGKELDWKKMSPEETVDLFQKVIPIGSEVFKQKVTFIEGKVNGNESQRVLFFVCKLGKQGDSVVINWKKNIFDEEGQGFELKGDLNVAQEKIPGHRDSLLLSSMGVNSEGKKWEMIRKFQVVR